MTQPAPSPRCPRQWCWRRNGPSRRAARTISTESSRSTPWLDAGLSGFGCDCRRWRSGSPAYGHEQDRPACQHRAFASATALGPITRLVVVRMDQAQLCVRRRARDRKSLGLVEAIVGEDHFGARRRGYAPLSHAAWLTRHDDDGADAQALRMIGHALRVVAGGYREHACRALPRVRAQAA